MESTNDAVKLIAKVIEIIKPYQCEDFPELMYAKDLLDEALSKLAM